MEDSVSSSSVTLVTQNSGVVDGRGFYPVLLFFSVGFRQRSFSQQSSAESPGTKAMPVFMVLCISCKQNQA